MDLNYGSTIIGIIALLICILPIIIIHRKNRGQQKQLFDTISKLALKSGCEIHHFEVIGNKVVGMDEKNGIIFYTKVTNEGIINLQFDLRKVKCSNVYRNYSTSRNGKSQQTTLEKLELRLILRNQADGQGSLEFYNADESYQPTGEIQSIEKWADRINAWIKQNSKRNSKSMPLSTALS